MIDTHKNVIRYVNQYVNNPTSLQMARISLIDEKITVFNVSFGKLFNFNIFIMI